MKLHVLVIDDEPFTLEMMSIMLNMDGFEVKTAADIPTAWEILTYEPLPDVICCDLMLPGLTGFDFLEQRREKSEIAMIPVIIISGCGQPGLFEKAQNLGAYACLPKPFDMKALGALIVQATYEGALLPV